MNLSHLKPGDKVRLRNGTVVTVLQNDGSTHPIQCDDDGSVSKTAINRLRKMLPTAKE